MPLTRLIDGHIHTFSRVCGTNAKGSVEGSRLGKVRNAGREIPFIPPQNENTSYPLAMLLETLAQHKIERAVLMQNPTIGSCNEEIGRAVLAHPQRLSGSLQVDPFAEDAVIQAEAWLALYPFRALKFELSTDWGWTGIHHAEQFHYRQLYPLMDVAREHHMVAVLDTGDVDSYAYHPDELLALARAYSSVPMVIEHGGYHTVDHDRTLWREMVSIGRLENVFLGISAMGTLLREPYPCQGARMLLGEIKELVGAEHLIWGSDAPATLRQYTYRQLIDWALLSDVLTPRERELTFRANAEHLYF